jgi:hypothetical protein
MEKQLLNMDLILLNKVYLLPNTESNNHNNELPN